VIENGLARRMVEPECLVEQRCSMRSSDGVLFGKRLSLLRFLIAKFDSPAAAYAKRRALCACPSEHNVKRAGCQKLRAYDGGRTVERPPDAVTITTVDKQNAAPFLFYLGGAAATATSLTW